jgi:hypothetical protein
MLSSYVLVNGYSGKCADAYCQQSGNTDNDPFVTHSNGEKCVAHKSCASKALKVEEAVFRCGFCKEWIDASSILSQEQYKQKLQEHRYRAIHQQDPNQAHPTESDEEFALRLHMQEVQGRYQLDDVIEL